MTRRTFALKIRDAIDDLLADGEVAEPFLGVILNPLSPQIAERLEALPRSGAGEQLRVTAGRGQARRKVTVTIAER